MSLSKTIIFNTDREVANALSQEFKLNELDEYGYTPLIQTAIVNSLSKSRLVLDAGADSNFPDLTGRTALHWAADNGNLELCKLLLQKNANVNAYTYAGQPVLVMPLLRHQSKIKRLLLDNGADLNFAQDFINTKLLGHRFELEGRADIIDHTNTFIELELEGFYLEFSLEIIIESLRNFRKNFGGKHLYKYFKYLDKIIASLEVASELVQYQNYLIDIQKYEKRINRLLDIEPLILPISFNGHAITLIKFYDMLVRCDRGEFGRQKGTVIFYEMINQGALTKSIAKQLLYKRQHREFINEGLTRYLTLEPRYQIALSVQRVGNCSWANIEATLPVLLFLFLLEERGIKKIDECEAEALNFHAEWIEWDKNRSLHFCLEDFNEASPARKAAKAALLTTILFQTCDYKNDRDQQKSRRILPIITKPDYEYILKSYFKVFGRDAKNENLKNLREFLDDYRKYLEQR